MATQEEFNSLYDTHLKPKLLKFEKQRKNIVLKLKLATIGLIILTILLFMVLALLESDTLWFLIISFFMFLGGMIYYTALVSPYKTDFKKEVVSRIVTFVDENLTYYPDRIITRTEFRDSLLGNYWWHSVDRWTGEDYVEGMLGFTAVKFSEVHAEYEIVDEDDNRNYVTLFKGLFFIFDFNKDFEGFTVVLPEHEDYGGQQRFNWLWKKTLKFSWKSKYGELVKLEDVDFEKEFVVYSNNQVTARYVLSTSLMRRLLKFRQQLAKPVYLSFVNGTLYMGIPIHGNLFEPKVFKTLLDFQFIHKFLEYMQLGKDIVEDLNLNTRIWSKEPVKRSEDNNSPTSTSDSIFASDNLTQFVS